MSESTVESMPSPMPPPTGIAMSPAPNDEEAVAIVAAMEALWPNPVIDGPVGDYDRARTWRFSGRWWNKPVAARRSRPFR